MAILQPAAWARSVAWGCVATALAIGADRVWAEPTPWVDWPAFGPEVDGLELRGHTNELPDFVGPIDGTARLVVFTEGNHFPVLLPMVYDEFAQWVAQRSRLEPIDPGDVLVVTLPQVMVVRALTSGSIRVGNATLRVTPQGGVFPHVVMGGAGPMGRLAEAGIVSDTATPFAKHRGMGMLLRRGATDEFDGLDDLVAADTPIVFATPGEAGARRQYRQTLQALVGAEATDRLFAREVGDFPGRLKIQHRDVPYALLTGQAEAGLIFGHLAAFYADAFPDRLRYVAIDEAAPFGQPILAALTPARGEDDALAEAFVEFVLERGREAYPAGGFAEAESFDHGVVVLTGSATP
ncbi:MAG: substrate-binding domain-containing protein [Planctomycetota bacterium]